MDIRKIKKLIDLLEGTSISEIEIKEGEESVRLSRGGQGGSWQAAAPVHHEMHHRIAHASLPVEGETVTPPSTQPSGHVVRSPMVGTFYAASAPEMPPFVSIGQVVKVGDALGIIEAMKMFNEIESDRTGKIIDILIKNGEPVEYDQPLFIIEE